MSVMGILKGFQKSFGTKIDLVIVTSKRADFLWIKKSEHFNLTLIDPFKDDDGFISALNRAVFEFENVSEYEEEFDRIVAEHGPFDPDDMELETLRRFGYSTHLPRKMFILDEAKDYLSVEKGDDKEEAKAKEKLIKAAYTHMRRNARFLSLPILVSSQTDGEQDLGIPLRSFALRFSSATSEKMSKILSGSDLLTDLSFRRGKFFLKTEHGNHILRMPHIGR